MVVLLCFPRQQRSSKHVTALSLFLFLIIANYCSALSLSNNKNVARIRAAKTSVRQIQRPPLGSNNNNNNNNNKSLDDYMKLPASQYACVPMPLNSSLDRIRGTTDQFRLCVPPMQLKSPGVPGVEVRPVVLARVTVEPDQVVIFSDSCILRGSKIIEDIRINDFFDFTIKIILTWDCKSGGNGKNGRDEGSITARSEIDMYLDAPGPFALVPRNIIEAVGNQAMTLTLEALLKDFMWNLGLDFERWASDEKYRMERKKLGQELGSELSSIEDLNESLLRYLTPR